MAPRAFVSHVNEEAGVAARLKTALTRDFLGLLDVFVSSDAESIGAGEEWSRSIERALQDSAMLIVLCSPASVGRPWINFEAGAAWMRGIPLVPICHAGLTASDLPMPLSLRQGVVLDQPDGLKRLYARIAEVLKCQVPARSLEELARELASSSVAVSKTTPALTRDRAIRKRLTASLHQHRFRWRTLERLAAEAAISQDVAADFATCRFGRAISQGQVIRTDRRPEITGW